MADIRPFKKNPAKKTSGSSHTLCKSGFHKWKPDTTTDFAVKQGRLSTRYQCERCGKTKIEWR